MIIPGSTYTNVRRFIYRQLMRNDDNTWKHIHKQEEVHLQTANEDR